MVKFRYDSEKTREVCRSCGANHKDYGSVDKMGYCEECGIHTGHLGFTNEEIGGVRMNTEKFMGILLIISVLVNLFWGLYMYPVWYPQEIDIPNSLQIDNFCQSKGFDNGWLSDSSCGINQVQCHKSVMDMDKYECIKWEKVV